MSFREDICRLLEAYGLSRFDVISVDGRDVHIVVRDQDGQPMTTPDGVRTRPVPLYELKKRDRDGHLS